MLSELPVQHLKRWRSRSSAFTDVDRALAFVHVGLAHIRGFATNAMGLPEALVDSDVLRDIVLNGWRVGASDVRIAMTLDATWLALHNLGQAFGLVSPELHAGLATWATSMVVRTPIEFSPLPTTDQGGDTPLDPTHPLSNLDPWLQQVAALDQSVLESQLCDLERYWCQPHDVSMPTWGLSTFSRIQELPKVISWPEEGEAIADWVRDLAIGLNGRALIGSTGAVTEWILVAESEEEAAAMRRSSYAPEVRIGREGSRNVMVYSVPFDDATATMSFGYPLDVLHDIAGLVILAITRRVRVDLLQLDDTRTLVYLGSWHADITDGVASIIDLLVRRAYSATKPLLATWSSEDERVMSFVAAAERAAFESLWAVDAAASAAPCSPLKTRWTEYLQAEAGAAAAALQGAPVDQLAVEGARDRLIAERNRAYRPGHQVAIENLDRGEAYLVVTYAQDSSVQMQVRAVWKAQDGPQGREFDLSEHSRLLAGNHDPDELRARLTTVLSELRVLQDEGIQRLFINVAGAVYDLPFHDALLRNGFDRVAYTHTLDRVSSRLPSLSAIATVYGSAGEAGDHLDTLDLELRLVAETWSTSRADSLDLDDVGDILHLAGHGNTGQAQWEIFLQVNGPNEAPLSAADVLLSNPTKPPALVVLSACSTGAGMYSPLQPMDAVPLDIAFLQRGAHCVISTAAPVNDYMATFFAIVLHSELATNGDVWSAYIFARRCSADAEIVNESATLRAKLDAMWPDWQKQLASIPLHKRDDWRLYRVVGRPSRVSPSENEIIAPH